MNDLVTYRNKKTGDVVSAKQHQVFPALQTVSFDSDAVACVNKSKEPKSSENNSTTLVTSLQKTLNNVEYCKPKLSIPVSFKCSCSDGVLNILSKHGFKFKDKAEVNSFILRFLASKDLPIYLENKNYLGEINHVVLNLFTCSENFDEFFGWMKEEKRVMAAKHLVD